MNGKTLKYLIQNISKKTLKSIQKLSCFVGHPVSGNLFSTFKKLKCVKIRNIHNIRY